MKTYITEIDGKWYAFAGDMNNNQVYSIGSSNPPKDSGCAQYFAKWTDAGIKYVSSPSPSRNAAYSRAKRAGEYSGEV